MTDLTDLKASSAAPDPTTVLIAKRGVWRIVRRRPLFWICSVVVVVLAALSLLPGFFAGLFGSTDPYDCDITLSGLPPEQGHAFGFHLQGCDIYTSVIYAPALH